MITKGSAVVVENDVKVITNLYEGSSFGEMSLLSDAPTVASVKASSGELHLMRLFVEDFKEMRMKNPEFSRIVEEEGKKIRELRDKRSESLWLCSR
jgi:signal-transduction protein with cAMP-binding, CBS, and nucleotidyltransferase domain